MRQPTTTLPLRVDYEPVKALDGMGVGHMAHYWICTFRPDHINS
jgi:hypothetical protein